MSMLVDLNSGCPFCTGFHRINFVLFSTISAGKVLLTSVDVELVVQNGAVVGATKHSPLFVAVKQLASAAAYPEHLLVDDAQEPVSHWLLVVHLAPSLSLLGPLQYNLAVGVRSSV